LRVAEPAACACASPSCCAVLSLLCLLRSFRCRFFSFFRSFLSALSASSAWSLATKLSALSIATPAQTLSAPLNSCPLSSTAAQRLTVPLQDTKCRNTLHARETGRGSLHWQALKVSNGCKRCKGMPSTGECMCMHHIVLQQMVHIAQACVHGKRDCRATTVLVSQAPMHRRPEMDKGANGNCGGPNSSNTAESSINVHENKQAARHGTTANKYMQACSCTREARPQPRPQPRGASRQRRAPTPLRPASTSARPRRTKTEHGAANSLPAATAAVRQTRQRSKHGAPQRHPSVSLRRASSAILQFLQYPPPAHMRTAHRHRQSAQRMGRGPKPKPQPALLTAPASAGRAAAPPSRRT
jgi:hypothetical protein